jgi:hypothetical protein
MDQRIQLRINLQDNISATTAITAGRPAARHKFFPAHGARPVAAIAAFDINLNFIEKHDSFLTQLF